MHDSLEITNNPMISIGRKDSYELWEHTVDVPIKSFIKYMNGESAKQAFPNLKKSDYEFLERGQLPGKQEEYFIEL
jgi:hypothetical protein